MSIPPDPINDLEKLKDLFPDMPAYVPEPGDESIPPALTSLTEKEKSAMKLYVSRDKKMRGGKQVTLIEGHEGPDDVRQQLLSALKGLCSAGGSLKDGMLLVQGDHVKKVISYLVSKGYKNTKQKGG